VERGQVIAKPGSITPHKKFRGQVYVLSKDEAGGTRRFSRATGRSSTSDDGRDGGGGAAGRHGDGDAGRQREPTGGADHAGGHGQGPGGFAIRKADAPSARTVTEIMEWDAGGAPLAGNTMLRERISAFRHESYDHRVLDESTSDPSRRLVKPGAQIAGPIPLPTVKNRYTVLRSPHVDKKSRSSLRSGRTSVCWTFWSRHRTR